MGQLVKCKYCGQSLDKRQDNWIYIEKSRRYAHKDCLRTITPEIQQERDRDELAEYIRSKFGEEEYKNPKTWVMVERCYKQKMTPKGIFNTLTYMIDIKHKVTESTGLGLIPYYYKEAQEYFIQTQLAQEKNKITIAETDTNNFYNEVEVCIKSPQRQKQKKKLFTFLDEEEI